MLQNVGIFQLIYIILSLTYNHINFSLQNLLMPKKAHKIVGFPNT